MSGEPWRQLGYATDSRDIKPPDVMTNASVIKANLAEIQDARRKTLMRDFEFMSVWQTTDTTYVVVNFKTISLTDVSRGRYDVDLATLQCSCRDQFYTYADEGTGALCKHLMLVGLMTREDGDE